MLLLVLLTVIFLLALAVGVLGNITGLGGGAMIILFLVYGFNFSPLDAAGLSLLALAFSALTGLIQNVRQKLVDMRLFFIVATIATGGAVGGSVMANYIPSSIFKGIFAIVLIALGLFSVYASHRRTKVGKEEYDLIGVYSPNTGFVSLLAGVVSGLIGIGIGGIVGTYLTAIKNSSPKISIATIISATLPIAVVGTSFHFYYTGFVNIAYAPPLVIGALIGAVLGSWVIRKAPQVSLRFLQGYMIITFGVMSAALYFLSTY